MKYIIKTFGLISLATVVYGANAAVSRVSMVSNASRRIPSLPAGYLVSGTTSSASTAITFSDTECIDTYTACLKSSDVCGADMEECTTNVLLHAKMPNCLSTLYQCSSNGVASLFGTSNVAALSDIAQKNSYGEVTRYTYPTDGSVLGQMVIGASISNKLSTDQCVRRYTNCLKRDSVCGDHFELCTSWNEFKRQSITCASTLARCQSDGLIELFGTTNTSVAPNGDSRIGVAISDGAQYAAANAVKTCYNVVDACLVNACTGNPWRCVEGTNMSTITSADFIAGGLTGDTTSTSTLSIGDDGNVTSDYDLYALTTNQEVRKFIKGKCLSTIGGNKSCYMTFLERVPKDKDLADIDNQEDVFSLAYAARKEFANAKIQDALKTFDKRAKDNCIKTITECVKRSCGKGLGTLCYQNSRDTDGSIHVNNSKNYKDIKAGCKAIVDTDANCQYAANSGTDDGYMYAYVDDSVFSKLFPEYGTGTASGTVTPSRGVSADDPLGAIASLNAMLATSYNDGALANLKKQCQTVALSCVRSMCGTDFVNCYRNRTDIIIDGTYNTNSKTLDRSMNKVGGLLDYNIVIGLCMNTVKTSSVCEEHLKLATADWIEEQDTDSWGSNTSVRDAWYDSNTTSLLKETTDGVLVGCAISADQASSNENCIEGSIVSVTPPTNDCSGVMDESGCLYTTEIRQGQSEYVLENGAKTLFQTLLRDVELEVQMKYNAKLTKEQNMCVANNNGGLAGKNGSEATFQWVKLKSGKVPSNYAAKGLSTSQFTTSNDLYGSFCRAKITIMSDDKAIQDNLGGDSVAYFAVGDPFTCGSWIKQSTLDTISKAVGDAAYNREKDRNKRGDEIERRWWTIGSALVGGVGGYAGMDAIQRGNGTLGGLLSPSSKTYTTTKTKNSEGQSCLDDIASAEQSYARVTKNIYGKPSDDAAAHYYNKAVQQANSALSHARKGKANVSGIEFVPLYGYTSGTPDTYEWVRTSFDKAVSSIRGYYEFCDSACGKYLDDAENMLLSQPKEANPDISAIKRLVRNAANSVKTEASKKSVNNGDSYDLVNRANSAIGSMNIVLSDKGIERHDFLTVKEHKGEESRLATLPTSTDKNGNDTLQSFQSSLSDLKDQCQELVDATEDTSGRLTKNLIAGVAGAGLSALTAYHIVDDAQKLKYSKAEREAIDQWMNEVGSHIKCYLGGEELGSYGDVISFELN